MTLIKLWKPMKTIQSCPFCTVNFRKKPIITIPAYVKDQLKKKEKKDGLKRLKAIQEKSRLGNSSIPLISCKNSDFNHNFGRVYNKKEHITLASQGWEKVKSWGDYFIIHPYAENPSLIQGKNSPKSFGGFNLNENVLDGIERLGFKTPTLIQSEAIPVILRRENTVCCAETGSGKTLAYLAPMLHNIMEDRDQLTMEPPKGCPFGLIIVPGRELAQQVAEILCALSSHCGVGVKLITGGNSAKSSLSSKSQRPDILVGTLGIMQRLISTRVYNMDFVRHIILDECDTIVDDTFIEPLLKILKKVNIQGKYEVENTDNVLIGVQLSLVGATVPKDLKYTFHELLDTETLTWIKTPQLHKLMPHIKQTFLRIGPEEKADKLLEIMKRDSGKKTPTMIFCNRAPAAHFVSKLLEENGISNGALHGDAPINERLEKFGAFQNGDINVLVCSDLGSRGLDTIRVKHVINFEFPLHMSDYIHRVGRTGRVGTAEGAKCTNFIGTNIEVSLVKQIEMAARMAASLPNVDANIRREIENNIIKNKTYRPNSTQRLKPCKY